jgi:hypothetical protein
MAGQRLRWLILFTVVSAALCVGSADVALSTGNFTPTNTVKLCAYTGANLQTSCSTDGLTAGANADTTSTVKERS